MYVSKDAAVFIESLMLKQNKFLAIIGYKKNKRCGASDFRITLQELKLNKKYDYHYDVAFKFDENAVSHGEHLIICMDKNRLILKDVRK
ncbi:hypothetical protein [Salipaludibacillus sp. CF4.18]|uniref:hypothetical protein n=1 Tax=Salipaludibacillus sp. CF4.18 TaxID=3373081 RepID=UPI003EE651E8